MNVYSTMPGYKRLANIPRLSKEATRRLKWFDYYNSHDHNARLTCRHFDISPQTFYRWKQRSPKLNRHVERAQRTHTEEFYEITDANFNISELII